MRNISKFIFLLVLPIFFAACSTRAIKSGTAAAPAPPQKPVITLTFTGDTTLGDYITAKGEGFAFYFNKVNDPSYFLKNMKSIFEKDDLTIVNFEGTITDAPPAMDKPFLFKGPKEYLKILTTSSVEVANLANNHTHDFGQQGYDDTKAALTEAGIEYFGYEDTLIKEIKGSRLCFHGSKGFSWERDSQMLKTQLASFKGKCDFIITAMHWGVEREYIHDALQKRLAEFAIDNGSNLVVGHHAHVVQDKAVYKGVPIYYGLGNFCFGGNKNPKDKNALVIQVRLKNNKILEIEEIPISISSVAERNNYQPTPKQKPGAGWLPVIPADPFEERFKIPAILKS